MNDKYPMQPIMNGRFESNPIVDWLCTEVSSMNDIAHYCAENDIAYKYREQLAQLVGYSVGGYGSLSYVSDESYERAENQMNIDNLATQAPEEKEVLDLIDTTPHQYEIGRSKLKSNPVIQLSIDEIEKFSGNEWNGEGLPPVGVECDAVFIEHEHKGYGEFLVLGYHDNYVWMEYIGELSNKSKHYTAKVDLVKFRKPESPQQREERERLEAAYDLYVTAQKAVNNVKIVTYELFTFAETINLIYWLAIVDKTNYRKESN